ncbi:putative aaa family atpase [Phaeomoniella chlamydospora]|uniref:Putative aaa family atpase n=1 Tax=Phaeomoniella chlamydospora TaxID=158046 RepID=A0A0G2EZU0_PHACM|nr:putative aaa family atpase [Phaeomoniella chlamydospora]
MRGVVQFEAASFRRFHPMETINSEDNAVISDLQEQVKRLETRLAGVESHSKADSVNEISGFMEVDEASSGAHGADIGYSTNLNYIPGVRICNFMEFKNRFSDDDARYAVDVLVSGALFEQEYLEEQGLRDRLFEHGSNHRAAKRRAEALVNETNRSNDALRNDQSDRTWIRRIRLQAPALLQILAKVQGETWSPRPRTYDRPFCTLLEFHPQVKQALAELEEKWATQSEGHNTSSPGMMPQDHTHEHGEEDSIDDSQATLAILQSYVDFIDKEVLPGSRQFESLDYSTDEKIIFSDLCYLFKPGEYIYRPLEGEQSGEGRDHRMGQRIWRVFFVNDAVRNYNLTPPDHRRYSSYEPSEDDSIYFTIHAYHVDYTGDEFCLVTHIFKISPYEGWKPITTLPVYPIRFDPGHEVYLETSRRIGDQVLRFIESKHAFYNAWSVMRTPQGGFATDANGAILKHPEYVNSEVMVDFGEAFQACPSWRPTRTVLKTEFTNKIVIPDDFTIRWWSGKDRTKLLRETREIIPYRTGVHHLKRNKFVLEDPFLVAVARNHQRRQLTTKQFLRREEKVLMYCRVFAYVFQERKFAQLDVSRLTLSARNLDALEALKISPVTKKLIQGSVRGHFLQKETEGKYGEEGLSLDVIQGKGTGLFILLHGVPGVGKTATAESIALANGKPLFKITCGDIGLTPDQVEASLRAIFRLASIWDCILLIDEVDTFFSQRSKGDSAITKNALVSVFLRVLDYYTGILFLTTNRSGALDEAFKSRIHYKIYYPPLTKDQALDIWKLNIQRLRHISEQSKEKRPLQIFDTDVLDFAEIQFDDCHRRGIGQWNGRQIRNAFQVARSLAYYDALTEGDQMRDTDTNKPDRAAVLDVKYFRMMHDITESFDHYMLEVFSGMNDRDLALEMEHRADHWTSDRSYRSPAFPLSSRKFTTPPTESNGTTFECWIRREEYG